MTITQIQAFLEVAHCQKISEAAKRLYITQPALGRQLTAMEAELNMQLLIRSNRGIKLTPAGKELQKEFEQLMVHYQTGIYNAKHVSRGYSGRLLIGVLEELNVMDEISEVIDFFAQNYPNVDIRISRKSFSALLTDLYEEKLDAVISLDVNFYSCEGVELYNIMPFQPAFAVPINHPLAQRETLDFADFADVPLVIVGEEDCAGGVSFIQELFMERAGFYPILFFTDSQKDAIFWVESGKKCAILNMQMSIADSKRVKMFPFDYEKDVYIQLAVKSGTHNFAIDILKDLLLQK